jgi:hypothetical protein|tara:strand:- start:1503 stop:1793 length:291 start_codon:yes stop_codon:yes gene_type:complete
MLTFTLMAMGYTATIDKVEDNLAHVLFAAEGQERFEAHIPVDLIPCDADEGTTLYIRKTNESTQIRCTEFPPPTVEVIVDPATGAIRYRIKDIPLE